MDFDIKTIIIICLTALGMAGITVGHYDVLLAVVSGLLGFLSKDIVTTKETVEDIDAEEGA